jgi:hypothetical protein
MELFLLLFSYYETAVTTFFVKDLPFPSPCIIMYPTKNSYGKDYIMSGKKKGLPKQFTKQYMDLLYMTPNKITTKDIAAIFGGTYGLSIELWAEMDVLELILPNQNSIDFEPVDIAFKDPSDAAFVKNRGIASIYAINLNQDDMQEAIPYFEQLVNKYSGFICADSEDFTPVYVGNSKR